MTDFLRCVWNLPESKQYEYALYAAGAVVVLLILRYLVFDVLL